MNSSFHTFLPSKFQIDLYEKWQRFLNVLFLRRSLAHGYKESNIPDFFSGKETKIDAFRNRI
jgi:hypothetical protein